MARNKKVTVSVVKTEPLPQKAEPVDLEAATAVVPAAIAEQQFPAGQSGNPQGAPKGKRMTTRISEILQMKSLKKNGKFETRFDDAADAYVRQMERGSLPHFKEYLERTEGKVTQGIDLNVPVKQYEEGTPTEGEDAP